MIDENKKKEGKKLKKKKEGKVRITLDTKYQKKRNKDIKREEQNNDVKMRRGRRRRMSEKYVIEKLERKKRKD